MRKLQTEVDSFKKVGWLVAGEEKLLLCKILQNRIIKFTKLNKILKGLLTYDFV